MTEVPLMRPLLIYHGGCWDGFGAAMIIRDAFSMPLRPDPVELLPAWYGMDLPDGVDDRSVWVLDFSFRPEQMVELADRAASVVWIDHHKTAVEACGQAMAAHQKVTAVTDMDRSGARLAWDYMGDTALGVPWEVQYIEDRDLWRRALPDSDAVAMWIRSHPMTVEGWRQIVSTPLRGAVRDGRAMSAYHETLVRNAAANAIDVEIGGFPMPLASCSYDLGSDVCDLLIRERSVPVAAYFLLNRRGEWQYGLRSRAGWDCSSIAKQFGGGGHAQAAGFQSPAIVHTTSKVVG